MNDEQRCDMLLAAEASTSTAGKRDFKLRLCVTLSVFMLKVRREDKEAYKISAIELRFTCPACATNRSNMEHGRTKSAACHQTHGASSLGSGSVSSSACPGSKFQSPLICNSASKSITIIITLLS